MAALGAQSIASSYEQLLHVDADGGGNTTTHVSVKDGDNGTTFGFTIATDALMMSSTNRLEFGDTGTYIHQSADGVLDLVSDTEIEINATTIDVNGALDLSGNAQLSGTVTVGADGSGTDVIFYSGTAGDNFTWDASEEKLTITGTNAATALDVADGNVTIADDLAVDGTSNLDNTDIDGTFAVDGTTISLDATTSFNIDNTNTSNGVTINTATSGGPISIGHTTSETTVNDNLVVTGDIDLAGSIDVDGTANLDAVDIDGAVQIDNTVTVGVNDTGYDVKFFGATATNGYMLWDESTDDLILGTSSKLGLGVTAPAVTLHVHTADAGGSWIQITDSDTGTGGSDGFLVGVNGDEDSSLYNAEATAMIFSTSATARMTIDADGAITAPAQPAFLARPASNQNNFAIDTATTVVFGTEVFDQGGDFASNTFTAPVTGKYQLNVGIRLQNIDSASDYYYVLINTHNRTYNAAIFDPDFGQDNNYFGVAASVLADMDASDTAYVQVYQASGTQQTDIDTESHFSGYLAC